MAGTASSLTFALFIVFAAAGPMSKPHASLSSFLATHANVTRSAAAPASAAAGSPAASIASAPGAAEIVGECGCVRKTQDCTCGGWLDYLQCVSHKCHSEKCGGKCPAGAGSFIGQCQAVQRPECASELVWECGKTEATCQGIFHQERDSLVGLTVSAEPLGTLAYCGPWGKCQGELRINALIHRNEPGFSLECKLPLVVDADKSDRSQWQTCSSQVDAGTAKAGCTMPMVKSLEAGSQLEGRCWLNKGGEKITKNAWFTVANQYSGEIEPVFEAERREAEVFHHQSAAFLVSSSMCVMLLPLAALFLQGELAQ